MERYNPFQLQYGFTPLHSASLFDKIDKMLLELGKPGILAKFHVKTLFYQFVYELLQQLNHQQIGMMRPNLATQITRYIHEHYSEPITLKSIAQIFHYSVPYLSKHFRQETGSSIIDFLIRARVDNARDLLRKTDITIQEASTSVGYADVSYFIRIFKKHTGMTPIQYKDSMNDKKRGFDRPIVRIRSSLVPRRLQRYIGNGYENHYQYTKEGNLPMYRNKSSMQVSLLIVLTLLLSACSSAPNNKATSSVLSPGPAATQMAPTTAPIETITYAAVNGDIKIPKNPQRIVVLANQYVGYFLALGLKPAGITENPLSNPYFAGKLDGVQNLGDGSSLEKILDLKPDLIIVYDGTKNIEQLAKIAPTVAIKYGDKNFKDRLIDFGLMTNTEDKAKIWIANWDKKIAEYKPKVEGAVGQKTVSILNTYAKGLYVWGSGFGRGGEIIYGEFKLKAPAAAQKDVIDSGTGFATISLEKLPEYAGDYIFTSPWLGDTADPAVVYDSKLWKTLPAVKQSCV